MGGEKSDFWDLLRPFDVFLENSLLHFQDFALGATPGVREVLKRRPGGDILCLVSLHRIIYVMALETDPFFHRHDDTPLLFTTVRTMLCIRLLTG